MTIGGEGKAPISFTTRTDIAHFVGHVLTALPAERLANIIFRIEGDRIVSFSHCSPCMPPPAHELASSSFSSHSTTLSKVTKPNLGRRSMSRIALVRSSRLPSRPTRPTSCRTFSSSGTWATVWWAKSRSWTTACCQSGDRKRFWRCYFSRDQYYFS